MGHVFGLLFLTALSFPVVGTACYHYVPFGDRPNNNVTVDEGK